MIRRFIVLILLCQQSTHKQNNLRRKTCSIIVTDVNYELKTSISSKSNKVNNFNNRKKGFYLNKTIVLGVFSVAAITMDNSSRKMQIENINV